MNWSWIKVLASLCRVILLYFSVRCMSLQRRRCEEGPILLSIQDNYLKCCKEEDRSVKSLSESLNGCQKWHKEDHTLDYIPVISFLRRLLFQLDSVVWSFFQLVLQQSHYVENSSTELHLTSSFWIESTSDGITLWLNQKN